MKIGDWLEAKLHLERHFERTEYDRVEVRALPGETFHDPTGWRFAVVMRSRATNAIVRYMTWRVGPRGGVEAIHSFAPAQWAYLRGIWP